MVVAAVFLLLILFLFLVVFVVHAFELVEEVLLHRALYQIVLQLLSDNRLFLRLQFERRQVLLRVELHEVSDEFLHETLLTHEHLLVHEVALDDSLACHVERTLEYVGDLDTDDEDHEGRKNGSLHLSQVVA